MNVTSAPSARSASATASAGTTCPAVPPAAITILLALDSPPNPAVSRGRTSRERRSREGTARTCAVPPEATLSSSPIAASITIRLLDP